MAPTPRCRTLSANGKWVAFASADPYVGSDDNEDRDIYERGPLF